MDKIGSDVTARQKDLEGEMEAVKSALNENCEDSKMIKHRVDKVERECADLNTKFDSFKDRNDGGTSHKEKEDLQRDLLEKATNHMQSRMDRKNNIIVHGAPEEVRGELELWVRSEKIKHDKAIILELCLNIDVECYVDDILDIKRIGKFKGRMGQVNEEAEPRPIIVTLKEGIKEKIMKNVFRLKNTENKMLKRVRISHDMSKEERQKEKELRMEAKRRNEQEVGNFFYVVRGNPWERYILKLKKRETQEVLEVPQTEGQEEIQC